MESAVTGPWRTREPANLRPRGLDLRLGTWEKEAGCGEIGLAVGICVASPPSALEMCLLRRREAAWH